MSDTPHQLDRIEGMLAQLVNAHPGMDTNLVHKSDVQRQVVEMFSHMLCERKIEAIRQYRALTGYGIKESKDAIEAVMSRMTRAA
jgi:ribosomal protein L7/L12